MAPDQAGEHDVAGRPTARSIMPLPMVFGDLGAEDEGGHEVEERRPDDRHARREHAGRDDGGDGVGGVVEAVDEVEDERDEDDERRSDGASVGSAWLTRS